MVGPLGVTLPREVGRRLHTEVVNPGSRSNTNSVCTKRNRRNHKVNKKLKLSAQKHENIHPCGAASCEDKWTKNRTSHAPGKLCMLFGLDKSSRDFNEPHDQKKGTINQSSDNIVGRWTHMFSMFHSPVVECEIANQGCHR